MATVEQILEQTRHLMPHEKHQLLETIKREFEEERAARLKKIEEVQGKYSGKLSSVDEFIARKADEIALEDRRTGHLIK